MTPQFTTPCSVLITDKDKREEACDKLKCLGYEWNGYVPDILQCIYVSNGKVSIGSVGVSKLTSSIDCGTNIPLFLDLAGMREDTDEGQLFRFCVNPYNIKRCRYNGEMNPDFWSKMTPQEIINHHKQKGETK